MLKKVMKCLITLWQAAFYLSEIVATVLIFL